jgi:hypothetical protein
VGGVEVAGEVATVALEQIDPHPLGVVQQVGAVGEELGGDGRVEVVDRSSDGVDMSGRNGPTGQRAFEVGHRGADAFAVVCGAGFLS